MVEIEVDGIVSRLDGKCLGLGEETTEWWDPKAEEWVTQLTGNRCKPIIATIIQQLEMEMRPAPEKTPPKTVVAPVTGDPQYVWFFGHRFPRPNA